LIRSIRIENQKLVSARFLRQVNSVCKHRQISLTPEQYAKLRQAATAEKPLFDARTIKIHEQMRQNNIELASKRQNTPCFTTTKNAVCLTMHVDKTHTTMTDGTLRAKLSDGYHAMLRRYPFISPEAGARALLTSYRREVIHKLFEDQHERMTKDIFNGMYGVVHISTTEFLVFSMIGNCYKSEGRPKNPLTLDSCRLYTREEGSEELDPMNMTVTTSEAEIKEAITANRDAFERNFWAMLQYFADGNIAALTISPKLAEFLYGSVDEMVVSSALMGDLQVTKDLTGMNGDGELENKLVLWYSFCPTYLLDAMIL
jgi:hypothetical protein